MKHLLNTFIISLLLLTNCATTSQVSSNNIRIMDNCEVVGYVHDVDVISHSGDYTMILYRKNDSTYFVKSDQIVVETIMMEVKNLPDGKKKIHYHCTETPGYRTWDYERLIDE